MNPSVALAQQARQEAVRGEQPVLIRLQDIHKTYHLGEVDVPVLRGISLTIRQGELVALMGASGSGKTTLMNLLGCLDRPTSGKYWFDNVEISGVAASQRAAIRATKIGFVFQNFNLLPRTTALANVTMPFDYAPGFLRERDMVGRGRSLLERVGLATRMNHIPTQMSGGQQQRVAIARALVNRPSLVLADEPTGNLDSHTSAEILRMFQQLNAEGITIILVTHDADVARHATRIIHVKDGRIDDGEQQQVQQMVEPAAPGDAADFGASEEHIAAGKKAAARRSARRRWSVPLVPPTVGTAVRALARNKMRSALTTLGVIIGVAAVIAMMEIGQGSKTAMQQTIASMGANNLLIQPGAASSGGVSFGAGGVQTLTPQDAEEVAQQCSAVADVAPIVRARTQVIYGNKNWVPLYIYGTTPSFLSVRDWQELDEGEPFTARDVRNANKVCLIGQTLVRELFNGASPIGKEIRIQNVSFRVVGALKLKGANMMGLDQDDIVLAPWTTIKYRVSGNALASVNQSQPAAAKDVTTSVNTLSELYPAAQSPYPVQSPTQIANTPQPVRFTTVDQILCKVGSPEGVPVAIEQINALLTERHHIQPSQPADFNIRNMAEMTKALSSTSELMSGLLLCVALISLVVGGVGIMNIMLVSVTERTREIGLRMAVGARASHILRQFLVEAILLCLFGGAVGILAGRGSSELVRRFLHWPTEISMPAIIAAVVVSVTVGVTFGFYPAWKASSLDPIEALRYE